MKKITKILALALVLTMCVCMFTACGDKSKIVDTVTNYYEAMIAGELDKAAQLVGDEDLKESLEYLHDEMQSDDFVKETYMAEVEDNSYEILEDTVEVEDNKATVKVRVNDGNNDSFVTVELEEFDGEWLVVETY